MEPYPLDWIDEYVAHLRGYIFVREEDGLLIKVPNEAHKLNPSGVRVLKRLLAGEHIDTLWKHYGATKEVRADLYAFFIGLKQVLQGCVNEHCLPKGVVARPFTLGFNTLPVLSEVALSYRCNLACRFCYAGCSCRKEETSPKLTTDDARRILRIIREDAQVPSVSFTGGEPTLCDDLPDLIRFARYDLGMRVNLITNGSLVDAPLACLLAKAGLNSAQVSVESPLATIHDQLTQVPGSWAASLGGLHALRDAGIHVHTNTTLNQLNLKSALDMPAFVKAQGLERFSMNLIIPSEATKSASALFVRYRVVAEWLPRIQAAARDANVEFMWYSPTPVCIYNPVQHQLGNKGCAACDGLLSVSPTGDVLPCSSWSDPVGNLLSESFRSVWDSTRGRWLRDKRFAHDACTGCADFALCQGGCPLYWREFGDDELTEVANVYNPCHLSDVINSREDGSHAAACR